jgi:hypothetical protein
MKLRLLALALTIGCLYSCSSAKKAQTTDDVYYSSGNQEDNSSGGYVANDGSDDRVQSTGDGYGQYAYGDDYAPFSTCISPFWGAGFGMGSYYNPYYAYSPFGFGLGMGFGWSSFYSVYPSYYGGFYNPYYPAYGYYTKPYAGGSPYFPGRIAAVTYNNRHFNNINTTVPTLRGITPGRPITNTVSGRAPISLASNKVVTSQWQPYRTATDNGRINGRGQTTSRTFVRQGSGNNGNVRTTSNPQPTYRPAPSNSSFGRSSGGFGGGGGGGRVGGGGGMGRVGRG